MLERVNYSEIRIFSSFVRVQLCEIEPLGTGVQHRTSKASFIFSIKGPAFRIWRHLVVRMRLADDTLTLTAAVTSG